eukprot:TRINITY_DN2504_c1_g2_i2.p2 TRINITY_DN2504_c1_g2~~TRINITY_DN2504_c1_g2_i2.p2  ORF type:complete len:106 (-),score=18.65 TRINITY_DN2504_c1_g2_i2:29-346(-)
MSSLAFSVGSSKFSYKSKTTRMLKNGSGRFVPKKSRKLVVNAYKVIFKTPDGDKVAECDEDTYVLDVADEMGLDLPYSCRSGACSSCAGKIETNEVIKHFFDASL